MENDFRVTGALITVNRLYLTLDLLGSPIVADFL